MRVSDLRKPISNRLKIEVLVAQARCASCGERLCRLAFTRFDHRPPLALRINLGNRFMPDANDPDFIQAVCVDCHQWLTTGRKPGATKTVTTAGSDIHAAAKIRRITKGKKRRGPKIPSRPFPKRS